MNMNTTFIEIMSKYRHSNKFVGNALRAVENLVTSVL